jgi:hypothetical protein
MINDFADSVLKVKEESIVIKREKIEDNQAMEGVTSTSANDTSAGDPKGTASNDLIIGQPGASLFDFESKVWLDPSYLLFRLQSFLFFSSSQHPAFLFFFRFFLFFCFSLPLSAVL